MALHRIRPTIVVSHITQDLTGLDPEIFQLTYSLMSCIKTLEFFLKVSNKNIFTHQLILLRVPMVRRYIVVRILGFVSEILRPLGVFRWKCLR